MVASKQKSQVPLLTRDEAWVLLDQHARRAFGIGLQSFIDRWLYGEYGEPDDNPDALEIAVFLPSVGVDPWRDGSRS